MKLPEIYFPAKRVRLQIQGRLQSHHYQEGKLPEALSATADRVSFIHDIKLGWSLMASEAYASMSFRFLQETNLPDPVFRFLSPP